MSVLERTSPKLAFGEAPEPVRQAVTTLEDMPAIPNKTPASNAADGYDGEICRDANYIYVYTSGTGWKRAALSTF